MDIRKESSMRYNLALVEKIPFLVRLEKMNEEQHHVIDFLGLDTDDKSEITIKEERPIQTMIIEIPVTLLKKMFALTENKTKTAFDSPEKIVSQYLRSAARLPLGYRLVNVTDLLENAAEEVFS